MFAFLEDILHRHQALELEIAVDHEHALEAMLVHHIHRFLAARAFAHGDQLLARRHDRLHRLIEVLLEAQVAVGHDPDHPARLHHREARDFALALQLDHLAHRHLGRDGHRVAQHARLEALHFRDFGGLRLRREVLVDDAEAAFLRHRDREGRLGHRVHGRGHEREVQLELPGEPRFERNVTRQDARVGGNEKNVVEGQRLPNHPHVFNARKLALYAILSSLRMDTRFSAMHKTIILMLSFFFAAAVSAQTYKWVDQDGKVRYGDVPPPGVKATPLRPPPPGVPTASAPAAKKDGAQALTPEQEFRKRQEEAGKEREKQAKADQEAQQKRENCARSQDAVRTLETGQRIARTDAQGERYYLEDAQVAQELAKARQSAQQWCN